MAERHDEPLERLRALDRAIARRGASAEARERVRRKLQQNTVERTFHARLRWWPVIAFAAGAVTMAVLLAPPGPDDDGGSRTEPAVAERRVETEPTCAALQPGLVRLEVEQCVQGDGVRVTARLPSRLRWDAARLDVEAGELSLDVAPRPSRPLHVALGEVDIEVVGTRFIVHRDAAGRWISMQEGRVRTRLGDGPVQELGAGQRLDWPGPEATSPGTVEPTPAKATDSTEHAADGPAAPSVEPEPPPRRSPAKPAERDAGLAALLDEIAALRRDGAYREAVERLRSADARRWSARARQLVSYEIGTLLERQLGDVAAACAHWAEHRRRFPGGRHDAIVARSMERLRCHVAE